MIEYEWKQGWINENSKDAFYENVGGKENFSNILADGIYDTSYNLIGKYNNATGDKGWIKKEDPYRFSTWVMFYNMYGKKYGLNLLKEAPPEAKDLHTSTDEKSQIVGTINMPQKINLNVMRGNWALVSVMDIDRTPKTGYVRWRSDNGVKYYFPAIK